MNTLPAILTATLAPIVAVLAFAAIVVGALAVFGSSPLSSVIAVSAAALLTVVACWLLFNNGSNRVSHWEFTT